MIYLQSKVETIARLQFQRFPTGKVAHLKIVWDREVVVGEGKKGALYLSTISSLERHSTTWGFEQQKRRHVEGILEALVLLGRISEEEKKRHMDLVEYIDKKEAIKTQYRDLIDKADNPILLEVLKKEMSEIEVKLTSSDYITKRNALLLYKLRAALTETEMDEKYQILDKEFQEYKKSQEVPVKEVQEEAVVPEEESEGEE